jgi:hypothetical protein
VIKKGCMQLGLIEEHFEIAKQCTCTSVCKHPISVVSSGLAFFSPWSIATVNNNATPPATPPTIHPTDARRLSCVSKVLAAVEDEVPVSGILLSMRNVLR